MPDLTPIASLDVERVRATLRSMLNEPNGLDDISRFLASVDWSGDQEDTDQNLAVQNLVALLGLAENALANFEDAAECYAQLADLASPINITIDDRVLNTAVDGVTVSELMRIGSVPTPTERLLLSI